MPAEPESEREPEPDLSVNKSQVRDLLPVLTGGSGADRSRTDLSVSDAPTTENWAAMTQKPFFISQSLEGADVVTISVGDPSLSRLSGYQGSPGNNNKRSDDDAITV
ncbi:hypothetical protein VP1G_10518 [Cytospora mali]|uniref:Uncharacterized protein n=1 Tax=Cytospora mali TaxID=578113 RepID=A0A194UNQ5_CYTMA|nr:hypothetical protein VP1G_10518 [Valsa mali var. pyri (nom. inval.)]